MKHFDYKNVYDRIIARAYNRNVVPSDTVIFHALPLWAGGDHTRFNIVLLSEKEARVAEKLSRRIYKN